MIRSLTLQNVFISFDALGMEQYQTKLIWKCAALTWKVTSTLLFCNRCVMFLLGFRNNGRTFMATPRNEKKKHCLQARDLCPPTFHITPLHSALKARLLNRLNMGFSTDRCESNSPPELFWSLLFILLLSFIRLWRKVLPLWTARLTLPGTPELPAINADAVKVKNTRDWYRPSI